MHTIQGLHEDIRVDAWKFLLKLFPWDSTEDERATLLAEKESLYKELKSDWRRILDVYIASNPKAASSPMALDKRENPADENDEPQETREVKMLERRHRIRMFLFLNLFQVVR
jgi:hypothetical protein